VRTSTCAWRYNEVLKIGVWSTGSDVMAATFLLSRARISYIRLLFHLIGGNLVDNVKEGVKWSGRFSHGVVNLVQSTCCAGLMSEGRWLQVLGASP
jgi:hypothetical protein